MAHAVVCETYPSEFNGHFDLPRNKTEDDRRSAASTLIVAAGRLEVAIDARLDAEINRGFTNDDAYDAFVGLLGMINVLIGNRPEAAPVIDEVRQVEGWILGQA